MNSTTPKLSILENWLGDDPTSEKEPKVVFTSSFVDVISTSTAQELASYIPKTNNSDVQYSDENKEKYCFIKSTIHLDGSDQHIKTHAIGDLWNNDMKDWMETVKFSVEQDSTNGEYYLKGTISDGGNFGTGWAIDSWTTHLDIDGQMTEERFIWQKEGEKVMSLLRWALYRE